MNIFGSPKKTTASDAPKSIPQPSWSSRLKSGLARTGNQLTNLFGLGGKIDHELYEELESILIAADVGMEATTFLLGELRKRVKAEGLTEAHQLKQA